jgi:hypothetical protein
MLAHLLGTQEKKTYRTSTFLVSFWYFSGNLVKLNILCGHIVSSIYVLARSYSVTPASNHALTSTTELQETKSRKTLLYSTITGSVGLNSSSDYISYLDEGFKPQRMGRTHALRKRFLFFVFATYSNFYKHMCKQVEHRPLNSCVHNATHVHAARSLRSYLRELYIDASHLMQVPLSMHKSSRLLSVPSVQFRRALSLLSRAYSGEGDRRTGPPAWPSSRVPEKYIYAAECLSAGNSTASNTGSSGDISFRML